MQSAKRDGMAHAWRVHRKGAESYRVASWRFRTFMATSGTSVPCVAGEGFGDCLTLRAWSFGSPDLVSERVGVNASSESSSDNDFVQQGLQSLVSRHQYFFLYQKLSRLFFLSTITWNTIENATDVSPLVTQQQVGGHLHSVVEG